MFDKNITHHIQRNILSILILVPSARFKDLKPAGMESNIFMYHLKALIKDGLVEKTENGYALTSKGKRFVDRSNLESLHLRIQPKLITIIVLENNENKIAILERLHQPFLNYKGFPSGKVHYGETLADAAERELSEKTGLSGIPLEFKGNFIMKFSQEDEVVNHIVGYVFYGKTEQSSVLEFVTKHFKSYWGDKSELFEDNRFKGHPEIFDLIKNTPKGQLFIKEQEFTSDW